MAIAQEKEKLRGTLEALLAKAYIGDHESIRQGLSELREDMERDFYTVLVVGEFKRGKSTLVNALLGSRLLPMDVLPETATINAILYAEEPSLTVVMRNGTERPGEASAEFLKRYSARRENEETAEVRYIKIGYPCELLRERVALVDTPGVSDLNEQRAEVTYQFLPKANAVLFVLDANSPLKKTERDFIVERLLPLGVRNILFVLNKYDMVDETEEESFLDEVKKRLLRAFREHIKDAAMKDIVLLPVSAKQALLGIEKKDERLLRASGLDAVTKTLREMLFDGETEREKLDGYRNRLRRLFSMLEREIESERAVKAADIGELREAAETLRQLLSEKEIKRERVYGYVKAAKTRIYAMTDKSLRHFHEKLKDNVFEAIEQYRNQDFKEFIERTVTKMIQRNMESWVATYTPHIDELLRAMERELALGLSRHFEQRIRLQAKRAAHPDKLPTLLYIEAEDISDTGLRAGAIAAISAVGIMAVFSSVLIPILSFWGRSKIFEGMLKKRLEEAKREVMPQVESQLAKAMMELSAQMHGYIDRQAASIQRNTEQAYEAILQDMEKRVQAQIDEKNKKGAAIASEMDALAAQADEVRRMMNAIG